MEQAQESLLCIIPSDEEEVQDKVTNNNSNFSLTNWKWWIQVIVFIFFILAGQSGGTILGKVYYEQGGKSNWLVTLTQSCGFPFLIPFLFISSSSSRVFTQYAPENTKPPSAIVLGSVYVIIGVLLSLCSILYSAAIEYLPASTYSLLSSSQLAFTAVFSFILNGQKFTPYVTNSVVILTFSSVLFVFKGDTKQLNNEQSSGNTTNDFMLGFVYAIGSSACCALMFSLTQLAFQRVVRAETVVETVKMSFWVPLFATVVNLIGMFWSGEWMGLEKEGEGYEGGVFWYFMVLVWAAVSWEAYNVGTVGLTFKVSSLFSNVVIMLSRVIVPFCSMVFLNEEFGGIEIVSLLMALWGFSSYIYQQYLDDLKERQGHLSDLSEC